MKKLIWLIFTALVILTACASGTVEANKESRFTNYDRSLEITIDLETGCKYIVFTRYQYGGGITPLMLPNGTQDCRQ